MKVGLLVWARGTADSNFLSTARLTGAVDVRCELLARQQLQPLSAESGTDSLSPVPVMQTWALWLVGLAGLGLRRRDTPREP